MEKVSQYFCVFCDFTNINIVLSFNHYKTHMYMKDNCEICFKNQLSSRVSQPNGECDHLGTELSFGEVQRKIKVIEAWINEFLVYQNKLMDKTFSSLLLSDKVCVECVVCRYLVDNYKKNGGEINQIQYINAQSIEQHCYKHLRYNNDSQEIRLLDVFIKECLSDTDSNDDNTLEVVCYPSSDFTDTSSHVSTERNEHISPVSLGMITLKLNMNETKLNKTNFELEEIKSDFAKQLTIKDEEIERLNTKITEFERSMSSMLECFDTFVENTNTKFEKTESELNIANNEIEKTKNELKKTCDELIETEINKIESKFERMMTTKLNDNENTIKSDFNKQLAIKDNEITKLYTKFTEFERSFTTNLNDTELFKVNLRKEFEKSLEKSKTEFTKRLSLKDREIDKLKDEMIKRVDTHLLENTTKELIKTKSDLNTYFTEELEKKDEEIANKFTQFERSMTTKLNDIVCGVETANSDIASIESDLQNTKIAENNAKTEFNTRLNETRRELDCVKANAENQILIYNSEINSIKNDLLFSVIPPGMIAYFAAESIPNRWFKANGEEKSRTEYANLFAAIGTQFGSGDGYSTFNLPELRGEFIRCWSDGRDGVDKNRAFGSFQWGSSVPLAGLIDENYSTCSISNAYHSNWTFSGQSFDDGFEHNVPSGQTRNGITFPNTYVHYVNTTKYGYITTWNVMKGTRPRNIALLACIKY